MWTLEGQGVTVGAGVVVGAGECDGVGVAVGAGVAAVAAMVTDEWLVDTLSTAPLQMSAAAREPAANGGITALIPATAT